MKLERPLIIVNFKTYEESSKDNAVKLAKVHEKAAKKTKSNMIIAVQALDLAAAAKSVKIPVFAQHLDPYQFGAFTGKILPEAAKSCGAKGTLLNHSENRIPLAQIKQTIQLCKKLRLITVVCVQTANEAKRIAELNPDYIAIEPPELIGGNISVSTARPGLIKDTVKAVHSINKNIPVICGAGIKNSSDVKKATQLGTVGILVASGIVKASNPEKALLDLISGLK